MARNVPTSVHFYSAINHGCGRSSERIRCITLADNELNGGGTRRQKLTLTYISPYTYAVGVYGFAYAIAEIEFFMAPEYNHQFSYALNAA